MCAEREDILANATTERIKDKMSEAIINEVEKIATVDGAGAVSVSKVMQSLGRSNRVFYNRFQNLEEVLGIVYTNTALKIRESLNVNYDGTGDFFEYVIETVTKLLIMSYDIKMKFNQYVFENDSLTENNYEWYRENIKKLFDYAKEHNLIKDVDSDVLGYAIWCFCRGYNADAVMRMPKEEAVEKFKYSFKILLDGIKK